MTTSTASWASSMRSHFLQSLKSKHNVNDVQNVKFVKTLNCKICFNYKICIGESKKKLGVFLPSRNLPFLPFKTFCNWQFSGSKKGWTRLTGRKYQRRAVTSYSSNYRRKNFKRKLRSALSVCNSRNWHKVTTISLVSSLQLNFIDLPEHCRMTRMLFWSSEFFLRHRP